MSYRDIQRKQPESPTHVIAIMNQKGGVGKSTTTVNLAAALGELEYKVLVVDFDPQGNTTSGFGIDKKIIQKTVYEIILQDEPAQSAITKTSNEHIDVIPATIQLAGAEVELVSALAREMRLKEALAPELQYFDYVLIDCPPSLGILTINALVACDSILIPIQCEFYALEGVTKLLESMKMVKNRLNSKLDVFGVLMTMYDSRTTISKQVVSEVKGYFGDKMFNTMIPRNVRICEAPSYGMSVLEYESSSRGAEAYRELAREVIERG